MSRPAMLRTRSCSRCRQARQDNSLGAQSRARLLSTQDRESAGSALCQEERRPGYQRLPWYSGLDTHDRRVATSRPHLPFQPSQYRIARIAAPQRKRSARRYTMTLPLISPPWPPGSRCPATPGVPTCSHSPAPSRGGTYRWNETHADGAGSNGTPSGSPTHALHGGKTESHPGAAWGLSSGGGRVSHPAFRARNRVRLPVPRRRLRDPPAEKCLHARPSA